MHLLKSIFQMSDEQKTVLAENLEHNEGEHVRSEEPLCRTVPSVGV